jgi:hypothetical protein
MNALRDAAARLEKRPSQDGVPYERYTAELWSMIDDRIPGYGPKCIRNLTTQFRLGGAGFRFPLNDRKDIGNCIIPRPSSALWYVYQSRRVQDLHRDGFFCFAGGKDENFWMFKDDGNEDPETFFVESTAWNGREPTEQNGMICPHLPLSALLDYGAGWTKMQTE